jgi:hypothetical protein
VILRVAPDSQGKPDLETASDIFSQKSSWLAMKNPLTSIMYPSKLNKIIIEG